MIPQPLDAVIFDMDGLLLDTEVLYRTAIFAACASQGQEMVDHVHLSLIGTPKDLGDAKLMAHFGEAFDLDLYHVTCASHFDGLCRSAVPLRPGALELLTYLKNEGVPRGIATSTARAKAETQLRTAGIFDLVDVLVTRSDVDKGKPHPETFLRAAKTLQAHPLNCLALEDSHNGVRAAAAAGMATIMIPDLLAPTAEVMTLCVGVLPSLIDVRLRLETVRAASSR
ncbi:HAD family hydrolase [Bosea sp. 2KB_26]|uniref:HAD family hydrolase n=1 Tax=Bosea sp. 2KB_26 TaxID=3237475 RepID=UPI003F927F62